MNPFNRRKNRPKFPLSRGIYARTILISAIAGFLGTDIVFRLMGGLWKSDEWTLWNLDPMTFVRDLVLVPFSIVTWIILVRFLRPTSLVRVIVIGLLSPYVGCILGLVWGGAGAIWAIWITRFVYLFAPVGLATSFAIWFAIRKDLARSRISAVVESGDANIAA